MCVRVCVCALVWVCLCLCVSVCVCVGDNLIYFKGTMSHLQAKKTSLKKWELENVFKWENNDY